ncbi:hypothetical protein, partial [Streptomyces griseorubiginosus]|uniref:hypothetical protein n=1 Tax=Streptomyces griseorubiginosus TaxID=67304 RepID=UPI001B80998F
MLYRQAAQATLAALAEQVIPMVPPGEAARVFFPGDGRPLDQLTAQLDALLEWDEDKAPELEAVMAAVAAGTRFYADLHGLTVPPVDPDLTRTLSELGHPVPATPDGERAALIRYVEELLLVHRRIGVVSRGHLYGAWDGADANAVAFRGAVFAMFAGRLSLAELFGAAQRAGVVDTDMAVPPRWMEPDFRDSVVVQADVAELHGLVPYLLSPESIDPALRRFPHEKRYAQMAADLLELDFDGSGDGPVVNDLIDDLDSGTVTFWPDKRNLDRWRQRRETFIAWLREHRHHYQGAAVGHLIALYLLGGPDATLTLLGLDAAPHAARKSVLRGRILGWLERLVQGADEAELPLVMRRNAEVAELAAHPALGTPQHLASLADDLASDQLMAELAEHAEMQRRALLTLPETGGPVWWGESVPGPSHGSVQPGVFARPALSRVMLDGRAAVRDAFEAVDRSGSGVPVVYWVEQPSRARAFGPFAQRPGDHAAYPDDVEFRPLKPQWVWDVQWQRWYLRIPLEQVDRTDGPVWRADPVVRLVSTDSGIPFAYSAINSSQWPEFSWHMVHLPGVMDYMVRSKDGSFGTLPTPPVASGFDSVGRPKAVVIETHGLSNDVMAAYSREGLAYGSGTVAARLADRMTRLTGRDPVTQDVLLVVCYAAQGARSSGQAAANRGRGGRVIAGNAVVVTGATSGRSVPLVYVQGEKGGPDPQWLQFGKQPVPVAAELWSALPFAGRRPGHRRWFGNGNRSWQDIAEQYEKFLGAALAANPGLAGLASGLAAALRSAGRPVIVQGESTLVNVMNAIDHATRDDRVYLVAGDGAERRAYLEERGLLVRTGEQRSMAALFAAQRAVVFDRQPDTTAADDHRGLLAAVIGWRLSTGTATLVDVLEDYARNVGGDNHGIDLAGLRDALLGDAVDLYDWARRTLAPFTGSWEDLPKRYDEPWQPAHHRMPHPAFASIAWRLFTRTATLAQVIGDYAIGTAAPQGVSTAGLSDALLGDVTDVYDWVRRNLAPHIGSLQDLVARHGQSALPPHHRMYLTHQARFAAGPIGDLKVPEGLVRAIGVMTGQMPPGTQSVAHHAGAASWADRQAAVSAWVRTHGGSPLDLLRPAHLTALFLATHEPDQRLLRAHTDGPSASAGGVLDFPYLLTQDSRFAQLSQDPALSDPGDPRHGEVRKQLVQRARWLADKARDSIPLHLGILGEALGRLPHLPEGERVYVAVHWPDVPGAAAAPMPEFMTIPAFQPAWRTLEDALAAVDTSRPGFHRTVIAVDGSAARDVSFASGRPGLRQAMFPWDTEIQVTSYGWMPDADGRPYESVAATDRTANTRRVVYGPQPATPQTQAVPGPSQPALVGATFSSYAIPVRPETASEARPAGRRLRGGAPTAQHSAPAQQGSASLASQPGPSSLPSAVEAGQSRQAKALFPSLYFGEDEEDWEEWVEAALRYEKQVGLSMAGSADLLHAAQATLDALIKQVAALVPQGEEPREFFPQDGRSVEQLRDDLHALLVTDEKDGKKLPSLTAVMDAVERGAEFYADRNKLQVVPVHPELTRELHELGYPVAENLSDVKAARLVAFERLLLVHGRIGVASLGARTGDFTGQDMHAVVFRNAAIASKLLQGQQNQPGDWADVPTLVEWLGAAQRAGVVDTDMAVPPRRMEPDVSTAGSVEADAAELYGLAPFIFDSEGHDLAGRRLPHETRYEAWAEDLLYPGLIDTEVELDTLRGDLNSDAMSIAVGSRQDRDLWQQRRWAFIEWMQEHRRRYPRAPYAGYLVAFHLLGGADALLMDHTVTAVPPAQGRAELERRILSLLEGMDQGAPVVELPYVMLRDRRVRRLAQKAQPDTQKRLARLAHELATDDLVAELAQHAEMARRALLTLPEAEGRVWWAAQAPAAFVPSSEPVRVPRLFQATSDSRAAMEQAFLDSDRSGSAPVVFQVEQPVGVREFGPFARHPGKQAAFPDGALFRPTQWERVRDLASGREYFLVSLEQVQEETKAAWQEQYMLRAISVETKTGSRAVIGHSADGVLEWSAWRRTFSNLPDLTNYVIYGKDGKRRPVSPPVATGFTTDEPPFVVFASHGKRATGYVFGPEGAALVSGGLAGRLADTLAPAKRQLLLVCHAASGGEAGVPSLAQNAANRRAGGSVTAATGESGMQVLSTLQSVIYADSAAGRPDAEWLHFQRKALAPAAHERVGLPFGGRRSGRHRLFETPDWQQTAENHEAAIFDASVNSPELLALADELTYELNRSGYSVVAPQGTRTLVNLMAAIDTAVHALRTERTYTLAEDGQKQAEFLAQRGILVGSGEFRSMAPLFDAYREIVLKRPNDETVDDRKLLLAAIALGRSTGRTLAAVLHDYSRTVADDNRGIALDGLRDALLGDAVDIYDWVRRNLVPITGAWDDLIAQYGEAWLPPHHQMYHPGFTTQTTGDLTVPEGLVRAIGATTGQLPPVTSDLAHEVGAGTWAERRTAVDAWVREHSESPLDRLMPAHLTALFLATHQPDHDLLTRAEMNAAQLPRVVEDMVDRGSADFPYLLADDAPFLQLSADPALRNPNDPRYGQARERLVRRAAELAPTVRSWIPLHAGMLAEALAKLPHLPAGQPVYVGVYWPSGDLDSAAVPQRLVIPAFQLALRTPEDALATVPPVAGYQRTVVEVQASAARDVSFASGRPGLRQAMFPWDTEVLVTSHLRAQDAQHEPFEWIVAADPTADTRPAIAAAPGVGPLEVAPWSPRVAGRRLRGGKAAAPKWPVSVQTQMPWSAPGKGKGKGKSAVAWSEPEAPWESDTGTDRIWWWQHEPPPELDDAGAGILLAELNKELARNNLPPNLFTTGELQKGYPYLRARQGLKKATLNLLAQEIVLDLVQDPSAEIRVRPVTAGETRPAGRRLRGGAPSAQHSAPAEQSAQQAAATLASQPGPSSLASAVAGRSTRARPLFPNALIEGPSVVDKARAVLARLAPGADLVGLARRLLHLSGAGPLDDRTFDELHALVAAAEGAGRAHSLAAVGAFDLERRGALADRSLMYDTRGNLVGRDWTGDMPRVNLGRYARLAPDGSLLRHGIETPWDARPGQHWLLSAFGSFDHIYVSDGVGNPLAVNSWDEFAELVRHDVKRPERADVVMLTQAVAAQTVDGPRIVADVLGVRVWGPNAGLDKRPDATGTAAVALVGFTSAWVPSDPGLRPSAEPGITRTVLGNQVRDTALLSTTVVTSDGQETFGRILWTFDEVKRWFEGGLPVEPRYFTYVEAENLPNGGKRLVRESDPVPLPFDPKYLAVFHFNGRLGGLPFPDGSVQPASLEEIAGYYGRRASVQALGEEDVVLVEACWLAVPHPDYPLADRLERPLVGQTMANIVGRPVAGANVEVGYGRAEPGLPERIRLIVDDIHQPSGANLLVFHPEPSAEELTAAASLLPGDLRADGLGAERALRWVRALRLALGEPGFGPRDATYGRLMAGLAALDTLRAGVGDTEPLTYGRLTGILGQFYAGRPHPPLGAALSAMLQAASAHAAAGYRLDQFLVSAPAQGSGVPSARFGGAPMAPDSVQGAVAVQGTEGAAGLVESARVEPRRYAGAPGGVPQAVLDGVERLGGEGRDEGYGERWWAARNAAA